MTFLKLKPRVINHRDYKHFNNEKLRGDLLPEISSSYLEFDNSSFDYFFDMYQSTLNQHGPGKQKYVRGNHMPFIELDFLKRNQEKN